MREQIKQTLFGDPKSGKAKQWQVFVEDDTVYVVWGRIGGKLQEKPTVCTGKNIGRANETTPHEQAILEATAKWDKQYKSKFYRPTLEEAVEMLTEGVMLSKKFIEDGDKLSDLVFVSPKLDGVRCKAVRNDNDVTFVSRGNDRYLAWASIKEELIQIYDYFSDFITADMLDGELYIHGIPLQTINSYVKVYDPENTERVVYNIFDVPCLDLVFTKRNVILNAIEQYITEKGFTHVAVVHHDLLPKSGCMEYDRKFTELGYEGVMFNEPDGYYEFQNKRSSSIQKYKSFVDSECKVTGCVEDNNQEGVLHCVWKNPNGDVVEFDCKMVGNHEFRAYENQRKLIDQWINFRYQQLTIDGKPQFPTGRSVRKCDAQGNPLE